jgi:hypothetical protein
MSESHNKQSSAPPDDARMPEQRRVLQPLSVVRGSRPRPSSEPPPSGGDAAARQGWPASGASRETLLELWMMLNHRQRWSSLVVLPSHASGSGRRVVGALFEMASRQGATPVRFLDAEGLGLDAAAPLVEEMKAYVAQGDRVVVLLDSLHSNLVGLQVALAAERALLCVTLGEADFGSAQRTLELVGKERFLGSVVIQPSSGVAKK